MRISICPRCGDKFNQTPGVGRWRKFCRPDCGLITKNCGTCGKAFQARPEQTYCTGDCRRTAMSVRNSSDPEAQRQRGLRGGAVRGAQLRGTTAPGYYLRAPNRRHVHRIVAEEALGRPLADGEVVHHEDQDKHNNSRENLIVFPSQAWHARHHKLGHCGQQTCNCPCVRLWEVML